MSLTIAQARRIVGLFPDRPEIAVLEGRDAAPGWTALYSRAWSADGVVLRPTGRPAPNVPVVAVVSPGGIPDTVRQSLAALHPDQPHRTVAADGDGDVLYHGRPLPEPDPPHRPTMHLTLTGRRTQELPHVRAAADRPGDAADEPSLQERPRRGESVRRGASEWGVAIVPPHGAGRPCRFGADDRAVARRRPLGLPPQGG